MYRSIALLLQLAEGDPAHLQQQPAVAEAADLDLAVAPRLISNGNFDNLEVEFGGTEQQIEIAEGIEPAIRSRV